MKRGALKGTLLAVRRILRYHPYIRADTTRSPDRILFLTPRAARRRARLPRLSSIANASSCLSSFRFPR